MSSQDVQYQNLKDFKVPPGFRGRSALVVQLWWIVSATLFRWSPQALFAWRNFLLRLFGAKVGRGVRIRSSASVTYPWKLSIGDYVWVGDDSVIYNLGDVRIDNHVAIAHRVFLCTGSHVVNVPSFDILQKPIVVEDEVWIANDVFVAPGITLSRGCVIGARSTVLTDMPAAMICVGHPCRAIRPRQAV